MKKIICAMSMFLLLGSAGSLFAAEPWQSPAKGYIGKNSEALRSAAADYFKGLPKDKNYVLAKDVLADVKDGAKKYFYLDVRFPAKQKYSEWGHIPGAVSIPLTDLFEKENIAKVPKDKPVVVICDTGHDENQALSVLRLMGYEAYGLKWGMMSWAFFPPSEATQKAINEGKLGGYPIEK
ncbi:MAG: rhodanese-like domain-containing protein [Desulfurivibrionaceae bacterium]